MRHVWKDFEPARFLLKSGKGIFLEEFKKWLFHSKALKIVEQSEIIQEWAEWASHRVIPDNYISKKAEKEPFLIENTDFCPFVALSLIGQLSSVLFGSNGPPSTGPIVESEPEWCAILLFSLYILPLRSLKVKVIVPFLSRKRRWSHSFASFPPFVLQKCCSVQSQRSRPESVPGAIICGVLHAIDRFL